MNSNYLNSLPKWIIIWLTLSMLINSWDVMYILLRPESFSGGKYAAIFMPYAQYIKIDPSYANLNNQFIKSLALMDIFQIAIGFLALCFNGFRKITFAILLAFSALLLTGTETVLVFALEAFDHFKHVEHNSASVILFQYILPNSLWIIFPFLGVFVLGGYMRANLVPANGS